MAAKESLKSSRLTGLVKSPWSWLAVAFLVALTLLVYGWLLFNHPMLFAAYFGVKLILKLSLLGAGALWMKKRLAGRKGK